MIHGAVVVMLTTLFTAVICASSHSGLLGLEPRFEIRFGLVFSHELLLFTLSLQYSLFHLFLLAQPVCSTIQALGRFPPEVPHGVELLVDGLLLFDM